MKKFVVFVAMIAISFATIGCGDKTKTKTGDKTKTPAKTPDKE